MTDFSCRSALFVISRTMFVIRIVRDESNEINDLRITNTNMFVIVVRDRRKGKSQSKQSVTDHEHVHVQGPHTTYGEGHPEGVASHSYVIVFVGRLVIPSRQSRIGKVMPTGPPFFPSNQKRTAASIAKHHAAVPATSSTSKERRST